MSKRRDADDHFSDAYSLSSADETLQHYRAWAATYDREIGEDNDYAQPRRCAEALHAVAPAGSIRILDAGCGTGLSGVALAAAGYSNLTGCDFSPEMLEQAATKGVYRTLFETDLNEGLANVDDESYDAVTAVGVFSFGHVSPDACDGLLRVIKPGGHFVIGLNEKFWNEGALPAKIDQLSSSGFIQEIIREHGDHLPGHQVMGWVLVLKKC